MADKQHTFGWEGTNRKGQRQSGTQIASSEQVVRNRLRKQGVVVIRVRKKLQLFGRSKPKVSSKDICFLSRQLATMLEAGVPLVQSLDIMQNGSANPTFQELMGRIKADVEAGCTLTDAVAKHPKYFDQLYTNLVNAGEKAGALENILDKIATYQEKTEAIKSKIKKALVYPIAVLVIAAGVTTMLLIFVVPQFESMFASFGAELPIFTQLIVKASEIMQSYWWIVLGSVAAALFAFRHAHQRSPKLRMRVDKTKLKLPLIGGIMVKAVIARYARTLATMFTAGVPLVEALESVSGATGSLVYEKAILSMKEQVSTGQTLKDSMVSTQLFTNLSVQMIAIGEESGAIDHMASKVADFYEREVDDAVDALTALLEPLVIVVVGILVGGIIVGMYLPIFQMGKVVG